MNIFEFYLKKYKQFIILIIGLPCSNKSFIAKELEIDLMIPRININHYLIPDKFTEKEINGHKFKIYDNVENYDWEKLNKDVNSKKESGVILYGNFIDLKSLEFDIDFTFYYSIGEKICKEVLIEKKLLTFENNDDALDIYIKYLFSEYENLKKNIVVNKYFNFKQDNLQEIYDKTFNQLLCFINDKLKKKKN